MNQQTIQLSPWTPVRNMVSAIALTSVFICSGGFALDAAQNPIARGLLPESPLSTGQSNTPTVARETIEEKLARARADLAAMKAGGDVNETNRPPGSIEEQSLRRGLMQRL